MRRFALITVAIVVVGGGACGGSLKEPDAGSGQRVGIGGGGGGTAGAAGADGGPGGQIVDVRPPDEPCSLAAPAMAVADETCRFAIPEPPCFYADPSHIGVTVGSAEIPLDPSGQDGWDYSDATQTMITIYGPSCDAVTGGAGVTIILQDHPALTEWSAPGAATTPRRSRACPALRLAAGRRLRGAVLPAPFLPLATLTPAACDLRTADFRASALSVRSQ